jgi:hypothetical protein
MELLTKMLVAKQTQPDYGDEDALEWLDERFSLRAEHFQHITCCRTLLAFILVFKHMASL